MRDIIPIPFSHKGMLTGLQPYLNIRKWDHQIVQTTEIYLVGNKKYMFV